MPSYEVVEALEHGDIGIVIGGCIVEDDNPNHECTACGHQV
jgi:hypothetical protein